MKLHKPDFRGLFRDLRHFDPKYAGRRALNAAGEGWYFQNDRPTSEDATTSISASVSPEYFSRTLPSLSPSLTGASTSSFQSLICCTLLISMVSHQMQE